MNFSKEYLDFYELCLHELKSRKGYTDAYLPMLERYVLITMKVAEVGEEIVDEEVIVKHTNKAKETNDASSPKLRMFILLSQQASLLAKDLKLSPIAAPAIASKKKAEKGFTTDSKMKVA